MLNKLTLQGRLTADPVLRYTQSGTAVVSFTVAWSDKRGENERKLFLPCTAWKANAEFIANHFAKGQEVVVEGGLVSRKWQDNNGNNRETVELTVDRVHFCGNKKETNTNAAPMADAVPAADYDDSDLPF